jgi:hypothetical protein
MNPVPPFGAGSPVDPRKWSAATIDDRAAWNYRLRPPARAALARAAHELGDDPRVIVHRAAPEAAVEAWQDDLAPVREALEHGRGFAILDEFAEPGTGPGLLQAAYWLLGHSLGRPVGQNVAGTLLYDVRDYGEDVARGARFSVTSAASGFHTDNSFGDGVVDYVGLLCLCPARSGGVSQLVSGWVVHDVLRRDHPEEVAVLGQPFHVDRRGGVRDGEPPTARHPVLRDDGREPTYRYLRHWIEAGHQKAGEPLTAAQVRALDVLDGVLGDPALRVEFLLGAGQILFINNRWLLHSRTAFEDGGGAEKRHYVRLWVQSRGDAGGGSRRA